jgi:hypothetical protein
MTNAGCLPLIALKNKAAWDNYQAAFQFQLFIQKSAK